MNRILLAILVGLFPAGFLSAQQPLVVAPNTSSGSNTGIGKFYYGRKSEPARAIEFKDRQVAASDFLANINKYFDIPVEFTFIEKESNTDELGMQHQLLQQYYKGIPLEGMGYRVHVKGGLVTSANGRAVRNLKLETQTTISEEQAFQFALRAVNSKDTVKRHGQKLIVSKGFTFTPESFSVAYQFDVDLSLIEQWRISVDARNGQILNKVSLVNTCGNEPPMPLPYGTATGLTNYYGKKTIRVEKLGGSSSRLVGQTQNGGKIATYDFRNVSVLSLTLFYEWHEVYDMYSSDNTYNTPYQRTAVSVQWAAEQAYEYYLNKHSRNSFDNNGSLIKSYVHVDNNMNNAFWTHNLLAFGDGNNNNPPVELDVVSHELTHGVTQFEANLQYYNEAGALNESFSDILGKAVEFDLFGDTATWLMARHFQQGGLRNLSNPNAKNQPDTYAGDMWYTGYEDNGGVHINSGVQNFWFYLLSKGGSGVNDQQLSYSINPIGIDVAAKIAYRNLTEYLGPYSEYLDSRIGSMLAAADLYGNGSSVYQEVDKAWDAVGVIDEPIITSFETYDITATTVKIKGNFMPRGNNVNYHFEYGTTPAMGMSSPVYPYTDKVEGVLTGLQSQTKYYLRLVATNENGSTVRNIEFTTISLDPLVKIEQTVDVTETTATLYGQVNPNSLPTSFRFEYGTTPSLGMVTPTYQLSNDTEYLKVSASVSNLQPRKTYYYRLVATNGFATTTSEQTSFFTATKPIITSYSPAAAPIGTEVTITGQNFNSVASKNLVSFGSTKGEILSSSTTVIKVKVPVGASLGPISLLDMESGLVAESVQEFVPTFAGEFKNGHLQLRVGSTDYIYQALVQDMDGDNKADIVARHYLGFSVFMNVNQSGDITEESFIRSTFNFEFTPGTLTLIDVDCNGLKDIVARYQNDLRIYPNLSVPGYVFFGSPVDIPMQDMGNLKFADYDQDGRIDMAGLGYSPNGYTLVIIRNQNPKGIISPENFVRKLTMPFPYSANSVYSDDLNNDGKPELFAGIYDKDFFPVWKNNSQPGAFQFDVNLIPDLSPERIPEYISQDLNQDGWKDIISHSYIEEANLNILENQHGSASVTMASPVVVLNGYLESELQTGDIDGNGMVDLVVGVNKGQFLFLKNKASAGEQIKASSFEKFGEYGDFNNDSNSSNVAINDLNGDGRPELIAINYYNRWPHEGYQMEIWQNSPPDCPDPSLVSIKSSGISATIVLPPNTTLADFEIDYSIAGSSYWTRVWYEDFHFPSGTSYQVRVRAKCYLGFTDYYYINFQTDCIDVSSFSVTGVAPDRAYLYFYSLPSLEIEYSLAGEDVWIPVDQYSSQISNLLPGTTYEVRYRGRYCSTTPDFKYKEFTTLCPKLSTLAVVGLEYNQAELRWASTFAGDAILEYSSDNVNWISIDESLKLFPLLPGTTYFVQGRMECTDVEGEYTYVSFTTPCPAVSTLFVDNVTPFSAKVNWTDELARGSYYLSYRVDGTLTTVETSSTSVILEGLSPGTQYSVSVAPICNFPGNFSTVSFNTVCYVPFDLSVSSVTYTDAELSWDDNFGVLPYSVDYSIYGSNYWITKETSLTNLGLTSLRPGTKYEVRVHINCASVAAPYASVLFETELYGETTFAPNPTDGKITIRPLKNLIGNRFSITDNTGRVLVDGELRDYTIDLSNFAPGIHILKIDGEKPIKIFKY